MLLKGIPHDTSRIPVNLYVVLNEMPVNLMFCNGIPMNSMFYWLGFSLNPMLFNGIRLKYWIEWKSTQCHWKETDKFKVIERIVSKLIAIADATTKNEWKFLNMDDVEQRALSKNILDEATKKQLGL